MHTIISHAAHRDAAVRGLLLTVGDDVADAGQEVGEGHHQHGEHGQVVRHVQATLKHTTNTSLN